MGSFCYRLTLSPLFSKWGRVFSFSRVTYGRRIIIACQNDLRKCQLIHPVLRLVLRCCLGILFVPLICRAEFGSTDSGYLRSISSNTTDIKNLISTKIGDIPQTTLEKLQTLLLYVEDLQNLRDDVDYFRQTLGYVDSSGLRQIDYVTSISKNLKDVLSNTSSTVENTATIADKTTKLAENSDSVLAKLDNIIAALEALSDSGGSSGGSGSVPEINQDWVKQDTFVAAHEEDKAFRTEYVEWWKKAFGFDDSSSSSSLKSYLFGSASTSRSSYSRYYTILPGSSSYPPFPGVTDIGWSSNKVSSYSVSDSKVDSFPKYLSYVLAWNLSQFKSLETQDRKKQSWNDWYAHTNLVANLWAIHNTPPTGDSPTIGFSDGVLTYKEASSSTGSSPSPTAETLDLNPAVTNSYESVVSDITSLTDDVASGTHTGDNPIDTDAIRSRYFGYLDIQGASTDIGDDIAPASSSGETLNINFMGNSAELDLASWGTSYRGLITQERLRSWRGAMGIIWMVAAWVGGFYLVKRLANME